MNGIKIFSKFCHYWLMEDEFRGLIYSSFTSREPDLVYSKGENNFQNQKYIDIFHLLFFKNAEDDYNIWIFLVCLLFPSRFLNDNYEYCLFGSNLSLGGNLFLFLKDLLTESRPDKIGPDKISLPGLEYYLRGRNDALLNRIVTKDFSTMSWDEKSYYLLGRDLVVNAEHLRLLLEESLK